MYKRKIGSREEIKKKKTWETFLEKRERQRGNLNFTTITQLDREEGKKSQKEGPGVKRSGSGSLAFK